VSTGYWPAIAVGTALVLIAAAYVIAAVGRARRRRHGVTPPASVTRRSPESVQEAGIPIARCRRLIAEAMIVRERMSGQIDAETYQARMAELAREAVGERRPHHNHQNPH
jgi:hypothetical protein